MASAFYLGFAKEGVKRRFLICNIKAGNTLLAGCRLSGPVVGYTEKSSGCERVYEM